MIFKKNYKNTIEYFHHIAFKLAVNLDTFNKSEANMADPFCRPQYQPQSVHTRLNDDLLQSLENSFPFIFN